MATVTAHNNSTPMVKRIIGIVLLLVGLYVTYAGYNESETLTMVLGVAAIVGGLCFLFIRPRHPV